MFDIVGYFAKFNLQFHFSVGPAVLLYEMKLCFGLSVNLHIRTSHCAAEAERK